VSRTVDRSQRQYEIARRYLAGGISSDARRMPGVPLFVDRAAGSQLWDIDGNRYIDFVLGQGAAMLGHCPPAVQDAVARQAARGMVYSAQHEAEAQVAEMICRMVPVAERLRFNTVGSEAVHGAIRLARGYTGRWKILKFEGHYHGWFDPVLYSVHPPMADAGPAESPVAVAGSGGQPAARDLVLAPWNDADAVRRALTEHDIAAVIMEPVLCNTGAIEPDPGYLAEVRRLCDEFGALLIFDEVITGFRLAPGGAQEYLGVTPDLAVFGKAVAGGMPVSVLASRAEVMDAISNGTVSHAGTFNSHPVCLAAAAATLEILHREQDGIYPRLFALGRRLRDGLSKAAEKAGVPAYVGGPGPVIQTYLGVTGPVRNYRDFAATDKELTARFHAALLDRGINIVPRGLWFLSAAHTEDDVDATLAAAGDVFAAL
jgi:glutamate-1-semialdehyde 2,1-aminomutase